MTNIIQFPVRARATVLAQTDDLHEAFRMTAFLLRDWEDFVCQVGAGQVVLVDADGQRSEEPFGREPMIWFAGSGRTATEIVQLASAIDPATPLPADMRVFFALWNSDGADDPILTYGDAIDMLDAALANAAWEMEQTGIARSLQ